MSNSFPAHGQFSLSIDDNMLVFYSRGPWNKELTLEIEQVAGPLIAELSKGQWGVLLIPQGDAIHIPESEEKAVALIKASKLNGRVATAIVTSELSNSLVVKNYLSSFYLKGGETYAFFDTLAQAKQWLQDTITKASNGEKQVK